MTKPVVPMSEDEYAHYRLNLWAQRGPNVSAKDEKGILPCYKHALEKCGLRTPLDGDDIMSSLDISDGAGKAAALAISSVPPAPAPAPSTKEPPRAASREATVEALLRGVASGQQEPFYLVDLDAALDRLALWRAELPTIHPHYAVKCNGDPALLLTLADAGVGFDCASQAEVEAVLALGVPASRIVYANPIKQPSHIRFASEHAVPMTVFDGEEELRKMALHYPKCELLLRIAVDDSSAQCVLSNKYGAQPADAAALLDLAASLRLTVAGVSFHVGSGSSSEDPFLDAVTRAAEVFALAKERGRPMRVLDVGGGFPGSDTPSITFKGMCKALRDALALHFPPSDHPNLELLAEPGRFFAAATHILAASVIGKKVFPAPPAPAAPAAATASAAPAPEKAAASPDAAGAGGLAGRPRVMYYINDGLYGSFNCVLYDHASPDCAVLPTVLAAAASTTATDEAASDGSAPSPLCSVWGPTCDGIDCVIADADQLPSNLPVGAWLWFPEMGAYTRCAGSNFNGMALPDVVYLQSRAGGDGRPQPPNVAAAHMLQQLRQDGVGKSM